MTQRVETVGIALLFVAVLAGVWGCGPEPASVATPAKPRHHPSTRPSGELVSPAWLPKGKPVRILFVGNSLTAVNDLPAMVQSLAAAAGKRVEYFADTPGGTNLDDHWPDGQTYALLSLAKWDYVVLQQGPSTQAEGRAQLAHSAIRWGDAVRKNGATPALYGVWPFRNQVNGFELCCMSYHDAAVACHGLLLPAGEAWREVTAKHPDIELYQADGLHPTPIGTYLAALVITEQVACVKPAGLPNRVKQASGSEIEIPTRQAALLQEVASETNRKYSLKPKN